MHGLDADLGGVISARVTAPQQACRRLFWQI